MVGLGCCFFFWTTHDGDILVDPPRRNVGIITLIYYWLCIRPYRYAIQLVRRYYSAGSKYHLIMGDSTLIRWVCATGIVNLSPCSGVGKPKKDTLLWSSRSFLKSIVMYCVVLCCVALHCIVLHCIVLYCIVLYCIVLYCIVL